jgi:pimeloyl-ACP methyl ester carboxylesterase
MLLMSVSLLIVFAGAAPVPADRLVDVGRLTLHIRCAGERHAKTPIVVLEAGAGNGADTWRDTQTPIAALTRVCSYDRPGVGGSLPPPQSQSAVDTVETLHGLLQIAGEPGPYILVGHSYGGMIVRLYASRYAADVTGMILVDSAHEDQVRRFAAIPGGPPPEATREQIDMLGMSATLSERPWHASIPLVVLTRGRMGPPSRAADPLFQALYRTWMDMQRDLASRSSRGEHIVATNSDHYIQNDEPSLVIDAVRRVVAAATPPD